MVTVLIVSCLKAIDKRLVMSLIQVECTNNIDVCLLPVKKYIKLSLTVVARWMKQCDNKYILKDGVQCAAPLG